jgi:DNA-binding GntR family transcriptional regulator
MSGRIYLMNQSVPLSQTYRKRSHKESLGESAYKTLKSRILERVLQPGEPLVEARLAEELGMSRTPVRDALFKLEQDGLVVSIPNKGTFVESLSTGDVAEIYDIREVIEGLAARLLSRRITKGQAEILEDLARSADAAKATVSDDVAFHQAIVRLCGSPRLVDIARTHCLQALTYDEHSCRLATDNGTPVIKEGRGLCAHGEIASIIVSGDQKTAEEVVRQHVRNGRSLVARYLLGI